MKRVSYFSNSLETRVSEPVPLLKRGLFSSHRDGSPLMQCILNLEWYRHFGYTGSVFGKQFILLIDDKSST